MTQSMNAVEHARTAAEAIRALNHATIQPEEGWAYPGDVYNTLGALIELAGRLPQALTQANGLLARNYTSGHLTSAHGNVHVHMSQAERTLLDADQAARDLCAALERAHSAFSPLGYRE